MRMHSIKDSLSSLKDSLRNPHKDFLKDPLKHSLQDFLKDYFKDSLYGVQFELRI